MIQAYMAPLTKPNGHRPHSPKRPLHNLRNRPILLPPHDPPKTNLCNQVNL
jgi:hypothetical protein